MYKSSRIKAEIASSHGALLAMTAKRARLLVLALAALVCLALPFTAWADSGGQGMDCAKCHPNDAAEWQESPHVHVAADETAAAAVCTTCHGEYVAEHPSSGVLAAQQVANREIECAEVADLSNQARLLAVQLEEAKQSSRSLTSMSVVSLGLGLGVGAILGVVGVLVICRLTEERV